MPTTPPPSLDQVQSTDVPLSMKERLLGGAGRLLNTGTGQDPNDSPLAQAMSAHHQSQVNLANQHLQTYKTASGVLAAGTDPDSGQPLTAERAQYFKDMHDQASEGLDKIAGVNKDVKAKLLKFKMLTEHLIGIHPKPESAPTDDSGQPTPQTTPPPTVADTWRHNADASRAQEGYETQKALSIKKQQAQTAHDFKMAEIEEAAKAKAANPTGRASAISPTSVSRARDLAKNGMVFKAADPSAGDEDGNIDLDTLPDDMMLVPLQQNGKVVGYGVASQKQTHLRFNNQVVAVPALNQTDTATMGKTLGADKVATTTSSEKGIDANTGTTITNTTRTPITPAGAAPRTVTTPPPSTANGNPNPQVKVNPPLASAAPRHSKLLPNEGTSKRMNAVAGAVSQLFGDPQNPDFDSLADYAKVADDPKASNNVGRAVNLIVNGMAEEEKKAGSLGTLLKNYGGVPQALLDSQLSVNKDVIGRLSEDEYKAFNAEIAALSTTIGLRALTSASSAKFSSDALKRDVPILGVNVFSSKAFNDKMGRLAEEVLTGSRNTPMSTEARTYIEHLAQQYAKKSGTSKDATTRPPKANASVDDEIMDAIKSSKTAKKP